MSDAASLSEQALKETEQLIGEVAIEKEPVFTAILCFLMIERLGSICYGTRGGTHARATRFMREYLSKVNWCYWSYADLIYESWRHGLLHHFSVRGYEATIAGKTLFLDPWVKMGGDEQDRKYHLHCFKREGAPDSYEIGLNLTQLCADIASATRIVLSEARRDATTEALLDANCRELTQRRRLDPQVGNNAALKAQMERAIHNFAGILKGPNRWVDHDWR